MTTFSRQSPSPRYRELLAMYRNLHEHGTGQQAARDTFDGHSLLPHAELIGALVKHFGVTTLLDYGAGKGGQYGPLPVNLPDGRRYPDIPSFWGVKVSCYDPGHPPFATPPVGVTYDAVISTDVVEHIPEEDLEWIVEEMFAAATKLLYVNAANYPAEKLLPDGENAHVTLRPAVWWEQLFSRVAARHPQVNWLLRVEERYFDNGQPCTKFHDAGNIRIG